MVRVVWVESLSQSPVCKDGHLRFLDTNRQAAVFRLTFVAVANVQGTPGVDAEIFGALARTMSWPVANVQGTPGVDAEIFGALARTMSWPVRVNMLTEHTHHLRASASVSLSVCVCVGVCVCVCVCVGGWGGGSRPDCPSSLSLGLAS